MIEWWNGLGVFQQILFILAMASTIIFAIQLILMLIGIGFEDTDFDVDIDNDFLNIFGLKIITIRGALAFLSIGSWTALVLIEATDNLWVGTLVGVIAGLIAMILVAYAIKKAMNLQQDGNINAENAIGKVANVYLSIPKNKSGIGKVNVLVQDRLSEMEAMTADEENIPTGAEVKVVDVVNGILIVKRIGE